jgi:hypothetical protein
MSVDASLTLHAAANVHLNLCSTCTNVFWRPQESWYDGDIYHDDAYSDTDIAQVGETPIANYLKSAQNQCHICKTSRDTANAYWIENISEKRHISYSLQWNRKTASFQKFEIGPTKFQLIPLAGREPLCFLKFGAYTLFTRCTCFAGPSSAFM